MAKNEQCEHNNADRIAVRVYVVCRNNGVILFSYYLSLLIFEMVFIKIIKILSSRSIAEIMLFADLD